jgi:hypothetical protein
VLYAHSYTNIDNFILTLNISKLLISMRHLQCCNALHVNFRFLTNFNLIYLLKRKNHFEETLELFFLLCIWLLNSFVKRAHEFYVTRNEETTLLTFEHCFI